MPWFAIYTKSRFEKKVALKLQDLGIESFCPMVKTIRKWSDRNKMVEVPLLPSYVFVNMEEQDRSKVFEVLGVVQFLYWLKKPAIIRQDEIDTLKKALSKTIDSFELEKYTIGDEIQIEQGPFVGMKGQVQSISNSKTVLVLNDLGFKIVLHHKLN
uniref:UpxY family transcription antiterminator n=1 Tax=Flavobacterium sp. TaxID=239 RepID=UPI0040495CDC